MSFFKPLYKCEIIGFLPGGNSLIEDISKSPYIDKAVVLGIGVAVMTSWSGVISESEINFFLWSTPNLCCSSIITSPKLLKNTLS